MVKQAWRTENKKDSKQGEKTMWKRKICVVVGGAKGRGSSLVEEYAGRRYHVAFMDNDKERGKLLKEKMEKKYGRKVFFFHGDAGSEEDLELFAGAVIGQYRKVDRLYYRTDIAENVREIEGLLKDHLKEKGSAETFC